MEPAVSLERGPPPAPCGGDRQRDGGGVRAPDPRGGGDGRADPQRRRAGRRTAPARRRSVERGSSVSWSSDAPRWRPFWPARRPSQSELRSSPVGWWRTRSDGPASWSAAPRSVLGRSPRRRRPTWQRLMPGWAQPRQGPRGGGSSPGGRRAPRGGPGAHGRGGGSAGRGGREDGGGGRPNGGGRGPAGRGGRPDLHGPGAVH